MIIDSIYLHFMRDIIIILRLNNFINHDILLLTDYLTYIMLFSLFDNSNLTYIT